MMLKNSTLTQEEIDTSPLTLIDDSSVLPLKMGVVRFNTVQKPERTRVSVKLQNATPKVDTKTHSKNSTPIYENVTTQEGNNYG